MFNNLSPKPTNEHPLDGSTARSESYGTIVQKIAKTEASPATTSITSLSSEPVPQFSQTSTHTNSNQLQASAESKPLPNANDTFDLLRLPRDMLVAIFQFLTVKDLLSLGQVSRLVAAVAADNMIWKELFAAHFPEEKNNTSKSNFIDHIKVTKQNQNSHLSVPERNLPAWWRSFFSEKDKLRELKRHLLENKALGKIDLPRSDEELVALATFALNNKNKTMFMEFMQKVGCRRNDVIFYLSGFFDKIIDKESFHILKAWIDNKTSPSALTVDVGVDGEIVGKIGKRFAPLIFYAVGIYVSSASQIDKKKTLSLIEFLLINDEKVSEVTIGDKNNKQNVFDFISSLKPSEAVILLKKFVEKVRANKKMFIEIGLQKDNFSPKEGSAPDSANNAASQSKTPAP